MKFKIRFADQIVGLFIILSIVCIVFVIITLGHSNRWFSRDLSYYTVLPSAGGLSNNMPVQYRGFTIGNVTDFYLNEDDDVEVVFLIFEEYNDRVRQGSMVQMIESPIGLGSQFQFHPGRGIALNDGAFIPVVESREALDYIRRGLADEPRHEDSISVILSRVNTTLYEINNVLAYINEAIGPGTDETEIGRMIGSLNSLLSVIALVPQMLDDALIEMFIFAEEIKNDVDPAIASINEILENVNNLLVELTDPDGLLYTVMDTEQHVYASLVASLNSISSILDTLDNSIAFMPSQVPQIIGIIMDLRSLMAVADDVLTSLTNNPILRGGIPDRPEIQGSGTSPRDLRF